MRKWLLLSMIAVIFTSYASEELGKDEFVALARGTARRNEQATYAKLFGTLQHRRRGVTETLSIPIYFGTIIHPERTIGRLILNGQEGYNLAQAKNNSGITSVIPMPDSEGDMLGYAGVRASDLTMSFLFCNVESELDSERLRGMIHCRVFMLDDVDNKEKVKVWISSEHAFPLKAEFYSYGENTRFRELEASALTKKNELYYVGSIRLEGPGWVTRIDFDRASADVNVLGEIPPQIFLPLKK